MKNMGQGNQDNKCKLGPFLANWNHSQSPNYFNNGVY